MSYVQSFGVSCSILIQIGPKITVNANFETTKGLRWYKIRSKTQKARQGLRKRTKNEKSKALHQCHGNGPRYDHRNKKLEIVDHGEYRGEMRLLVFITF